MLCLSGFELCSRWVPLPAVQTVENAIQWMRLYPLDNKIGFPNTYPLDIVIYLLDNTIQHLKERGLLV